MIVALANGLLQKGWTDEEEAAWSLAPARHTPTEVPAAMSTDAAPEVIVNPAMRPRKILYLAPGPDPMAVYRTRLRIAAFLEPLVSLKGDDQATTRAFLRTVLPLQSHVAADHLHRGLSLAPVVRSFDPDPATGWKGADVTPWDAREDVDPETWAAMRARLREGLAVLEAARSIFVLEG